ncbi:CGNR zinc finger domain-containing protein [Kitasatospora viridis]|uniref:Putative RNA-binding Zn ribbon-like protein n=1 Tax=Kitasatospora viridis TaxID=281105 RepID=A0A561UIK6_9ACTN|nr:CGNR zinc finger domain-containing protein [Kitasatospora viridis]TWF99213.1 putative RNA-binding Zn ribbon-like protein [Kitasatospora viridis]
MALIKSPVDAGPLALLLSSTVRHDGNGGVADDLADPTGLADWLVAAAEPLARAGFALDPPGPLDPQVAPADRATLDRVLAVRAALRALLARAVSPAPPSPADAHRLIPAGQAVARLNAAAAAEPVVPRLDWPTDGAPVAGLVAAAPAGGPAATATALVAVLARAAIDFLAGPDLPRLRACTAPRCVRYFLKEHGRQEFCKASCGNRARAARHYQRHNHPGPAPEDAPGRRP